MNKQNSTILFMPSDDSLRSEEFHRYFRKNILYVWINDKRCFEYMTKAQAMILMDSLIDPAYEGRVRSSALEETYKKLIRDSTHIRSPDALLNEGQYYLNLRNGVLDLRTLKLLTGKEAEEKAETLCFTYQLEFSYVDTATLKDAPAFCGFLDTRRFNGESESRPAAGNNRHKPVVAENDTEDVLPCRSYQKRKVGHCGFSAGDDMVWNSSHRIRN